MIRKIVVVDPTNSVDWTTNRQIWAAYDDVVGEMNLQIGDPVIALEVESGTSYPANVVDIIDDLKLFFLDVDWDNAKELSFE